MFAPGAAELAEEFNITNSTVTAMTISLYVLGFALGPLLLAPLSELYGRLIVYYFCNLVYIAFTIGCAFSTDVAMFLVFRIIAGCAASGPMSIGGGTVADLFVQEQRGKAMALFTVGPLLGPVSVSPLTHSISLPNLLSGCWSNYWRLCLRERWMAMDISHSPYLGRSQLDL